MVTSGLANTQHPQQIPQTIAGFLGDSADEVDPNMLLIDQFVVPVHLHNAHLAEAQLHNIFCIAGDPYLDLAAQVLYQRVTQIAGLRAQESSWKRIMLMLKRGIHNYVRQRPNERWIVFVDTNPSFIIYTQIAVATCQYLVVPIMPDMSSKVGVMGVCALVYGQNLPNAYQVWAQLSFSNLATRENVVLPTIKLIPQNRSKPYTKKRGRGAADGGVAEHGTGQVKAYGMIGGQTIKEIHQLYLDKPQIFACPAGMTKAKFRDRLMPFVTDFHGAGVISSVKSLPLAIITKRTSWNDRESTTSVNMEQIKIHQNQIFNLVHNLFRGINVPPSLQSDALRDADAEDQDGDDGDDMVDEQEEERKEEEEKKE